MTADDIRAILLTSVSQNGGHLASSLGAVELAMALHTVFDASRDRIVWDVGHQAYAWKILTGRADAFKTLRQLDGLSGFPNPSESPADAAIAGHAGVAISVAEGFAAARDVCGRDEHVVAVIGDASIANGTSLEALNNCAAACSKVIVILNDNGMSISKPTGMFARYLGRLIAGARYNRFKDVVKRLDQSLRLPFVNRMLRRVKGFFKNLFLTGTYFEQMGFRYMGPVDGHDLTALQTALEVAKRESRSVLLHIVTQKGRGFQPAEQDPTKWHGVAPFNLNEEPVSMPEKSPESAATTGATKIGWSEVFGRALVDEAAADDRIVALTAAMKDGTGLTEFAQAFPKRFYDVGISEGHMVSFAAGLAAGGLRPVVAVYSTFLQRAIDHVMHDVCIANLPVIFCVDRAGVVGSDGATHQGVFDVAMLRALPNLTICQPKDADDLKLLLKEALTRNGPTVIRYPRGTAPSSALTPYPLSLNPSCAIWATGDWYPKACAVAARVGGVAVHARYLKPFDAKLLARQRADGLTIVSLENGSVAGGFGEAIGADIKFGWPDEFIAHGTQAQLEERHGLDVESLVTHLTKVLASQAEKEKR